jgi:hypothetical protein
MSDQGSREAVAEQTPERGPQNTVFRRPCFHIAVNGSGAGATLGVQVVAAPPRHRES